MKLEMLTGRLTVSNFQTELLISRERKPMYGTRGGIGGPNHPGKSQVLCV